MVITTVIVARTVPEGQISTFPISLAIAVPPQFLWFQIQCPFDFCGKSAKACSHISSYMGNFYWDMLLGNFCIMLFLAFMATVFHGAK